MERFATGVLLGLPVILFSSWAFSMANNYNQCVQVADQVIEKAWQTGKLPPSDKIMGSEPCRAMDAQAKVTRAVLAGVAGR